MFDEEDAFTQVQTRVISQVGEPEAVKEATKNLMELASKASKQLSTGEELASPTEVATLPPMDLPASPGVDPFISKYLVVFTHARKCACLHLVDGCWSARRMAFTSFQFVNVDPPSTRGLQ